MRGLSRAAEGQDADNLREASEETAEAIIERAMDGSRTEVRGARYEVLEITWPVRSRRCGWRIRLPHATLTLLRNDAVLLDLPSDYWVGSASYAVLGERAGGV